MRIILFLLTLVIMSCNADKSPARHHRAESAADSVRIDSLGAKPSVDFVTGRFDFKTRDDFIQVDPQDANKEVFLQKQTYQAFKAMADSAQKEGIHFIIVSGTRNFTYQKSIWDRKWRTSTVSTDLGKAKEILEFSSMPMTSRHHWGTDLDLNHLTNSYFEKGQGKKEYEWLQAHANDFGFYQPYTNKKRNGRTGYSKEKWHWSYMPLAGRYLTFYNNHVTNADITGFKGSSLAGEIDMVKNYVNGVSVKIKRYKK